MMKDYWHLYVCARRCTHVYLCTRRALLLCSSHQGETEVITERVLPEYFSGFRKGRGCCGMIFITRQLLEKTREHQDFLFTHFVDLRKPYDSILREALWQMLTKCGVPPRMLKIVHWKYGKKAISYRLVQLRNACYTSA